LFVPEKIRVGVLFGGRSCEHEVSVTSARSVLAAMDPEKYDVTMIGISKEGDWLLAGDAQNVLAAGSVQGDDLVPVLLDYPGTSDLISTNGSLLDRGGSRTVDVVFPILHGPYGEDGTVQGLLELAGVAYVGAGVGGSAVSMDKELMKRVFRAEGLAQLPYLVFRRGRWRQEPVQVQQEIEEVLEYPVFVKPANLGSSVGITKVHEPSELKEGMDEAASYDAKILVEADAADCREVECAVLGNEDPQASVLGEIVPGNEFYDYSAKYVDDNSELIIPAPLSECISEQIQRMALDAFRAVDAAGMSRVDFFVAADESEIYLNEINTIPGFTPISMYPKLWQASGLEYGELIDRLIQLALERRDDRRQNRSSL
jgi:D-alanine-D-alanine ligase